MRPPGPPWLCGGNRPRILHAARVGHHGGVLDVTVDQRQRVQGGCRCRRPTQQRSNAATNAIEHQRDQVQVPERAGQQLAQRSLGGLDKPPRYGGGLLVAMATWSTRSPTGSSLTCQRRVEIPRASSPSLSGRAPRCW